MSGAGPKGYVREAGLREEAELGRALDARERKGQGVPGSGEPLEEKSRSDAPGRKISLRCACACIRVHVCTCVFVYRFRDGGVLSGSLMALAGGARRRLWPQWCDGAFACAHQSPVRHEQGLATERGRVRF